MYVEWIVDCLKLCRLHSLAMLDDDTWPPELTRCTYNFMQDNVSGEKNVKYSMPVFFILPPVYPFSSLNSLMRKSL